MRALLVLVLLVAVGGSATADDGDPRFRRTTPRGSLSDASGVLVIDIPGGRAWGIESELRALPSSPTTIVVRLAVADASVREAFVRVAYYASSSSRTRQLAISDSAPVGAGERGVVTVPLEPPAGAVAYRVRVLARLMDRDGTSTGGAVTARLRFARAAARPAGALYSLLLP